MTQRSLLDDPEKAALVLGRYRRIMQWMTLVTVTLVAGSLWVMYRSKGTVSIDLYITAAFGVAGVMLLGSAVLGYVFLIRKTSSDQPSSDLPQDERET